MGELLLCNESITAMPFYVDNISINVYSIEELCYYILNNTFLLDKDFMSEELCTWIDKEAKIPKLAEQLRDILRSEGMLSEFVGKLLSYSGYCTPSEQKEILFALQQMEEKSDFECNKIRADKLMENEKYLNSIYEYKRLLESEDAKSQNPVLCGNIYHNLGTAYARLFLFEEAVKCYRNAYRLNQKKESLWECLLAYRCMRDSNGFNETVEEFNVSDMEVVELKNLLSMASRSARTQEFEENLEAIAMIKDKDKIRYNNEITKIILDCKEEYRRICRI